MGVPPTGCKGLVWSGGALSTRRAATRHRPCGVSGVDWRVLHHRVVRRRHTRYMRSLSSMGHASLNKLQFTTLTLNWDLIIWMSRNDCYLNLHVSSYTAVEIIMCSCENKSRFTSAWFCGQSLRIAGVWHLACSSPMISVCNPPTHTAFISNLHAGI